MRRLIAVVSALLLAGPAALCVLEVAPAGALANGQTISFDEDPPSGLGQYTAIGVTYGTNNAGILLPHIYMLLRMKSAYCGVIVADECYW